MIKTLKKKYKLQTTEKSAKNQLSARTWSLGSCTHSCEVRYLVTLVNMPGDPAVPLLGIHPAERTHVFIPGHG